MNEPIVSVHNLSHRYSVQWAIRDITFQLDKTGIYGLLGANGAGKSTIMNIMCGVLKQSQGNVSIKGINLSENPVEAKKLIGFLPQKPPLQPELTVEEYLHFCARLRLLPGKTIPAAIEKVMQQCSLTHFRQRLIRNLSGGYQQRVGIAQAIIHEPDFVVLDEPTNGLDPNQILEVRGLIKEIAQERTILLSTHILQEVQALCDNIWMINEGRMIFSGSLEDFDNYITPTTLSLTLAAPPATAELLAIPGVVSVDALSTTQFTIRFAQDSGEVIQHIVRASVEKDWRLLAIGQEKNSLETVFAELSKRKLN
jgi:ABC-2 type transport system ATP-binding protein